MPHVYALDERASTLAATAARVAADTLAVHAADVDSAGRYPTESMAAVRDAGLLGLCIAEEFGGLGHGPRTFAAVVEELARVCGSTAMIYVMHVTASQAIAQSATLANREQLLRDIAAGRHLTTLAFSEKGSRSQFWAPVSTMAAAGEGFTVSAEKSWVTAANHADSYVSSGQKPGAASPMESTIYLVRRGAPGIVPMAAFNGLGLRGNDSAPVSYTNAPVAAGDLISALGEGAGVMLGVVLPWFVVGTSAMANGLSRGATEATAAHMTGTGFAHTGTALRDLPNLRARLADMATRTEQSRAMLERTLREMEAPSDVTPLFVLQARLSALETAIDVTDLGMKACGGAAFSKHLPLERLFRDARAGWVMAPTVDHLQDFIGKALTGLPLF